MAEFDPKQTLMPQRGAPRVLLLRRQGRIRIHRRDPEANY